ncbi:Conserved hypothetical protein CHP00255 [Rosistilla carotiformis]|uniref:YicC-like family, N-terminal region n=1 Tax=Rosistilla carotiformis TaxID=2528017 RepID=A0A518JSE6_9BACT|nr:YicC/YloC family endoribonuclease [Rosistilla carotiformis]QDV68464.1 Conserved hypothetical protein CHP00255 [Rosistilla carotiformis]
MLQSMTGQGQAQSTGDLGTVSVEIRSVNNRGLKLSARLGDQMSRLEPLVDAVVRQHLTRGSVNLNVRWQRAGLASAYRINPTALTAYYRSVSELQASLGETAAIDLSHLASLPGVIQEADDQAIDRDAMWSLLQPVLVSALEDLNQMRATEGASMLVSLQADLAEIAKHLAEICRLAPRIVDNYRDRLETRIGELLRERGLEIAKVDLLKEVQLFADRTDISEEITRLQSHLQMFNETVASEQASGRRLDFVIQEMFRETNTIGSKANDAEIAMHVVDMKCAIERMRELIQNIE